MKVCIKLWYRC